jgi:hypothetical protein
MTLDLNQLRAEWTEEYPGTSHALTALRDILISTDIERRAAQDSVDEARCVLDTAGIPRFWVCPVNEHYQGLVRQNGEAQRQFTRALKALEQHLARLQARTNAAKPAKAVEPEPKPPRPERPSLFYQTATIRIVDGKTITHVPDYPAAYWLKMGRYHRPAEYCRQLAFEDKVMPEEYAYAFTHEGNTYGPASCVFITYSADEFFRLCQLEVDTNSPHLLDGERVGFSGLE